MDTDTYDARAGQAGCPQAGPPGDRPLPAVRGARLRQPGVRPARHDGRVHAQRGRRAYVCAPASGGCGQSVLAEPAEAMVRDRVLATPWPTRSRWRRARAADATLDAQRAKLRDLLDDLDADMAETEAKLAATPR